MDSSHQQPLKFKTELCCFYTKNGWCRHGNNCSFAHGLRELRCHTEHPNYKTRTCKSFQTKGFCPYGFRCKFIHPVREYTSEYNGGGTSTSSSPSISTSSSSSSSTARRLPIFKSFTETMNELTLY